VNDRGPFVKDRIIDVSKKVAEELEFHNKGTTRVRIEYLKKESDKLLKDLGLARN
jgi:rare lipoprotein A